MCCLLVWKKKKISLRYHNLNPNYIHDRLKLLGQSFTLRVLLVQVDVVSRKSTMAFTAFGKAFITCSTWGFEFVFRKIKPPSGKHFTLKKCLNNKAKRKCQTRYNAISD